MYVNQKPYSKIPVAAQKTRLSAKEVQMDFGNSETVRKIEQLLSGPVWMKMEATLLKVRLESEEKIN